jgi:hypothetical protein
LQGAVAYAVEGEQECRLFQPMKQPLSLMYFLKEKRLVKRALYDLTVNRLFSRQESIIEIPLRLSTARGKKFHPRDRRADLRFPGRI